MNAPAISDLRLPTEVEVRNANELRQALAARVGEGGTVRIPVSDENGGELVLTPQLAELLQEMLRYLGSGEAVSIIPTGETLTTQKAADLLNVSRPHLIKLLEAREIPYSKVGRHRRVKTRDLLDYIAKRKQERADALSELAKTDAELGLV